MSRSQLERRDFIDTGSPLRNHSTNQHNLKSYLEGEKYFQRPRKVLMAERRKARIMEQVGEYEAAKDAHILSRVLEVKHGEYDGFCEDGFAHEVRYLKSRKILLT